MPRRADNAGASRPPRGRGCFAVETHLAVRPARDAVLAAPLLQNRHAQPELRYTRVWFFSWCVVSARRVSRKNKNGRGKKEIDLKATVNRRPRISTVETAREIRRSRKRDGRAFADRLVRTFLATSLIGKWKLALSTSRVRLLDWPPPRFCEVGDEWCQCRRRKAVASRVAGDVARDAARGRRTAGNHFPRGSRFFFRGVPEKADRRTRRARAETTGASAIRGSRARRSPNVDVESPGTALVHPSRHRGIRTAARVPWASSPNSCGCSVRDRNRFHRPGSFRLSRLGSPARAHATGWGRPRRDREYDHA